LSKLNQLANVVADRRVRVIPLIELLDERRILNENLLPSGAGHHIPHEVEAAQAAAGGQGDVAEVRRDELAASEGPLVVPVIAGANFVGVVQDEADELLVQT